MPLNFGGDVNYDPDPAQDKKQQHKNQFLLTFLPGVCLSPTWIYNLLNDSLPLRENETWTSLIY